MVVGRVHLDRVEALRVVREPGLRRRNAAWVPGLDEALVGEAAGTETNGRRHAGNIELLWPADVGYKPRGMEDWSAEVVVTGPNEAPAESIALSGDRVTVGRLPELNDIALQPDPELYVSRTAHCTFEREGASWVLVDGGSVNGTYVRRGEEAERIGRRAALRDGDVVCILAAVETDGVRRYFELSYRQVADAQRTRAAPVSKIRDVADCLVYEADAARLLLVQAAARHEIQLRPQGHLLVRYMATRNASAGGTPVLCGHDELMHAVWEDEPMHTRLELARLVWELRRELRRFGAEGSSRASAEGAIDRGRVPTTEETSGVTVSGRVPGVGDTLGGYTLESLLGRGGWGPSTLPTHDRLERKAALKVISPELAHEDEFRGRFLREAQLAASLDHPNVIPIFDAGDADGVLFLPCATSPARACTSSWERMGASPLRRRFVSPNRWAVLSMRLDAAGLVHRDVKPANILLAEPGGHIYLCDFGLAKRMSSSSTTQTGFFLGTADYCAPEQIEGRPLDARADVYSLGGVVFHSLTGQPPFARGSEFAVLQAHLADPPPLVSELRPELPRSLDPVVATALAKSPDDRYASAGAFTEALERRSRTRTRTTQVERRGRRHRCPSMMRR